MKFGDQFHGQITSIDDKGRGTFAYPLPQSPGETRTIVIPFTAPGDEVEATFVKRDQGNRIGKLQKIVNPSPLRQATPCPHAGVCGGCLWQHLSYEAQLDLKRTHINQALERAEHEERIQEVIPSSNTLHYRNRMDYVVGWEGSLGLKEYGSWNRYLDLKTCLLLDEETPRILEKVRQWTKTYALAPWDARKHTGLIRYCVIRLGKNTNERMVTMIVKDLSAIPNEAREELIKQLSSITTSLYLGENPEITDLSSAKTLVLLHGKEYLRESVNGLQYLIHPNSFFQTNTEMAAKLQDKVLEYLGIDSPRSIPDTRYLILDLYCGSGFFGLACAKAGANVYGHELDAPAIELAKQNAALNNVEDRITFGTGPVEDLDWKELSPQAVIIDPPRAGLHPRALQTLLEKQPPTIVYVSCNYRRLVEELKELKTVYQVDKIEALDLFPQTPHVEVVARLMKR